MLFRCSFDFANFTAIPGNFGSELQLQEGMYIYYSNSEPENFSTFEEKRLVWMLPP